MGAGENFGGKHALHSQRPVNRYSFGGRAIYYQTIHLDVQPLGPALALQDRVSQAWVNFARTGNPSQPGLAWKPYTLSGRETMVFDTVSELRSVDDDKLLSLLPPASVGGGRRG